MIADKYREQCRMVRTTNVRAFEGGFSGVELIFLGILASKINGLADFCLETSKAKNF